MNGIGLPYVQIVGKKLSNSWVFCDIGAWMEEELNRLRKLLPPEVILLVGGRAMSCYHDALERIGALQIKDLAHLCSTLDDLRRPPKKAKAKR